MCSALLRIANGRKPSAPRADACFGFFDEVAQSAVLGWLGKLGVAIARRVAKVASPSKTWRLVEDGSILAHCSQQLLRSEGMVSTQHLKYGRTGFRSPLKMYPDKKVYLPNSVNTTAWEC